MNMQQYLDRERNIANRETYLRILAEKKKRKCERDRKRSPLKNSIDLAIDNHTIHLEIKHSNYKQYVCQHSLLDALILHQLTFLATSNRFDQARASAIIQRPAVPSDGKCGNAFGTGA